MVEYPYVECTDSSVLGLTYFAKYYPDYKPELIQKQFLLPSNTLLIPKIKLMVHGMGAGVYVIHMLLCLP